jgi:RNA polymerase sigma-70 factor (ECF subfamily)
MAKEPTKGKQNAVEEDSQIQILRTLSAEELARRSQEGCRAAFAELVERYGNRLFKFLSYRTNNSHDTEDLVQDAFIKAYENIHRYKDSWRFSTWLFTIAARLANSHFRRSKTCQFPGENQPDALEPGQRVVVREMQQNLWAKARRLSRNQYQALWLKYGQDMSIKEIAKVLGKTQVNVKVLLYRARVNLAGMLQKEYVEQEAADQTPSKEIVSFMKVEGA